MTQTDGTPVLSATDVVYEIDGARLLDHVRVAVGRGEFLGIVGPNGAGKSTLLRVLSWLLKPTSGRVSLDGRGSSSMSARERARQIAYVPQTPPHTHGFTALEIVLMGRYPHMGRFAIEGARDREIALAAMEVTGSREFTNRIASTLSGGERQRVMIARALAQQPATLLLDEPTSNLDIQHQASVLKMVRQLVAGGLAAVAAIHDLPLAARYCDRLVLLSEGRVVAEGTPAKVLTASNIEAAFGVRSVVSRDPFTGALSLTVLDTAPAGDPAIRVHVVCGGGTGAKLLYTLIERGYTVTAGALGSGDTDRAAAEALGIEFVPVEAFGSITEDSHNRHVNLVRQADVSILCPVPIGEGNLRNLEALAEARRVISIDASSFPDRDYTGGRASDLFRRMQSVADCHDAEEVLAALGAAMADGRHRDAAPSASPTPL